jgi:hypothetical protein
MGNINDANLIKSRFYCHFVFALTTCVGQISFVLPSCLWIVMMHFCLAICSFLEMIYLGVQHVCLLLVDDGDMN